MEKRQPLAWYKYLNYNRKDYKEIHGEWNRPSCSGSLVVREMQTEDADYSEVEIFHHSLEEHYLLGDVTRIKDRSLGRKTQQG